MGFPVLPSKLVLSAAQEPQYHILTTRGGAVAARVAHNHEVPGSSPGPATKKKVSACLGLFSWSLVSTELDSPEVLRHECPVDINVFRWHPAPSSGAGLQIKGSSFILYVAMRVLAPLQAFTHS